jgi:predicted phosphodiesterase
MIGLISDAHGNGHAFNIALALLRAHGATRFCFLGDAIGYIPSNSVLSSLTELGAQVRCIRGNHEEMLLTKNYPSDLDEIYQIKKTRTLLSNYHLNMISGWPNYLEEELAGKTMLFIHGSPSDPVFGYVYPDTDLSAFRVSHDFVFMANTHRPFLREHNGTMFVNIGSCGLPRDDGRFGSAALFDPQKKDVRILRFSITFPNEVIHQHDLTIHPMVRELFLRRSDKIIGEKCQLRYS